MEGLLFIQVAQNTAPSWNSSLLNQKLHMGMAKWRDATINGCQLSRSVVQSKFIKLGFGEGKVQEQADSTVEASRKSA